MKAKTFLQLCVLPSKYVLPSAQAAERPIVQGPIGGEAYFAGQNFRVKLSERGYTEEEYFLSGAATAYDADAPMGIDGHMTVKPATTAAYTTRLVVRRPTDLKKFNGTVFVEWLNVSGATDASPDYGYLHRHLLRTGYAWIGVSAQKIGLDGVPGVPALVKPVKAADPNRYGSLVHPGDAYSFDIFSQVAKVLRGEGNAPAALRALRPSYVLAMGESQSAYYLVTYVNAIDPIARVFDGVLIHARGSFAPPLTGMRIDRADASFFVQPVRVRDDVRVPVLTVQSETDLIILGSLAARQSDSKRFRLWEIAGASHADTYVFQASPQDAEGVEPEVLAAALIPTNSAFGMPTGSPINSGPQQHYVLNAAVEHLNRWVRDGVAPPEAPRLKMQSPLAQLFALDEHGNVRGGIRSPWVDVPTAVLSGLGQTGMGFATLFGTTLPFGAAQLKRLYPGGRAEYLEKFSAATRDAVKAGFMLEIDEPEINAIAAAMYPKGQ